MSPSTPPPPGFYVPAVLFFTEDEELDIPAIKAHVLRLAQGHVTGILVQGSNGEAQHISHEERKITIQTTRQTLDENGFQNVLVIAGTGGQSTRETKKLNVDAKEAGASHALILTPSTWKPLLTKESITKFYREVRLLLLSLFFISPIVADASSIPIMVYNFAVVTAGLDLDSDTIATLGEHPNIVGTKLSCGHLGKLTRLCTTPSLPPSQFATFIGRSDSFLPAVALKSAGGIMALVNVAPKAHRRLLDLWEVGRYDEARDVQRLLSHGDSIAAKCGGIGFIKALVSKEFGYGNGTVRGPLVASSVDKLQGRDKELMDELIALEKSLP
ncbi:aldolase [Stereum hirsutum FP-91666 SS1]|uniref:aldolase n=1 Tax=Stereum hirsutum (strain FP-91666) TaxID=721885 RepID=UPI000440E37F|nr:aldolase [Stereum hirsutum FP-91666 SS1]EIM91424.1 aldolase [Stereum hirsutum FP-91666 SS1]